MAYIRCVSEDEANGKTRELYDADRQSRGYVPNYARAMSLHPEVYAAWQQLAQAIRAKMRLRRFELVTYAAALALRCRY